MKETAHNNTTLNWICLCHFIYDTHTHYAVHVNDIYYYYIKMQRQTQWQKWFAPTWDSVWIPYHANILDERATQVLRSTDVEWDALAHVLYPNGTVVMATIRLFHSLLNIFFSANILCERAGVWVHLPVRDFTFLSLRISRSIYFLDCWRC